MAFSVLLGVNFDDLIFLWFYSMYFFSFGVAPQAFLNFKKAHEAHDAHMCNFQCFYSEKARWGPQYSHFSLVLQ